MSMLSSVIIGFACSLSSGHVCLKMQSNLEKINISGRKQVLARLGSQCLLQASGLRSLTNNSSRAEIKAWDIDDADDDCGDGDNCCRTKCPAL